MAGLSAAFAAQRFGGQHTELKLQVLTEYLEAYLRVMKQFPFRLSYIDAFAGTGWFRTGRQDDERQGSLVSPAAASRGSALRALDIAYEGRRFDRLVFNDLKPSRLASLRATIGHSEQARQISGLVEFRTMPADDLIRLECEQQTRNDRAVMFLDPYGMQVSWNSITRIAMSGRIDVWYLAPVGIAFLRLMRRQGDVPDAWRRRLNEAMGGEGWLSVYRTGAPDLLGHTAISRKPGIDPLIRYFEGQWRGMFGKGALSTGLRLHRKGSLPYLLSFACSNPSPAARGAALRIAGHLVHRASLGRLI